MWNEPEEMPPPKPGKVVDARRLLKGRMTGHRMVDVPVIEWKNSYNEQSLVKENKTYDDTPSNGRYT